MTSRYVKLLVGASSALFLSLIGIGIINRAFMEELILGILIIVSVFASFAIFLLMIFGVLYAFQRKRGDKND